MDTNTGAPAFPSQPLNAEGYPHGPARDGMSLRDYFAAVIVTGLGNQCGDGCVGYMEQRARVAYQFADAMLAERAKSKT